CRVNIHRRTVEVRQERKYTTKAQMIPTLVFPNLSEGNVFVGKRFGELIAIESTFQVRESIIGYKERRGPNETTCQYPLDPTGNIYFDFPRFTRNFFTTGVTFTHPAMRRQNVKNEVIAQILFEVFLMVLPVERRDIHFAADRYRVERGPIVEGAKFVAIYDQTYGSLRLSARILEERTLRGILEKMAVVMKLRREEGSLEEDSETAAALGEILACLGETSKIISIGVTPDSSDSADHAVRVILPGSKGLNLRNNNEEFFVESVCYCPNYNGLAYRGRGYEGVTGANQDVKTILAIGSLIEIPGESQVGWYNTECGELHVERERPN
ncbi:MAG: hypothetical protein WCK00_10410, partial [Deltaproteobacteria bacterium]